MIIKIVLGTAAAAAISLTGLVTAPAQAWEEPTYTCEFVHGHPYETIGRDCRGHHEAFYDSPGTIRGFREPGWHCRRITMVRLPYVVGGRHCRPIFG